jgi:ribonuclease HII
MIKSYNKRKLICGIDEAGRGALAGPVTISAVILPKSYHNKKIKDSKRLSEKKRLELFNEIVNVAIDFSIVNINVKTIDEINILESTFLGMNQCINELKIIPDIYLIDGNKFKSEKKINYKCVVGGDNIYQCIAAASILAKVSRDMKMKNLNYFYPKFRFNEHKGYGTRKHILAINKYGLSAIHRLSFKLKEKQLSLKI